MDAHVMSFAISITLILSFASLGALAGYVHLALVSWHVRACLSQAHGAWALLALGRFATTAATFTQAAWRGALPLAAAFAGFLIIRAVLVRRPEILIP
jgi:hypothetical protein